MVGHLSPCPILWLWEGTRGSTSTYLHWVGCCVTRNVSLIEANWRWQPESLPRYHYDFMQKVLGWHVKMWMIGVTSSSSGALPSETDWKESNLQKATSCSTSTTGTNRWCRSWTFQENIRAHSAQRAQAACLYGSWDLWRTILEIQIS